MNLINVYILVSVLCIILLIGCVESQFSCKEGMEDSKSIPKIIWTYWEGEMPRTVKKCIKTWKKHNPHFEIRILNENNYRDYLPNLELKDNFKDLMVQHQSDIIRINIIAKYGGIWSDASILCLQSYDWILEKQKETDCEFIGYYTQLHQDPSKVEKWPVIENWFFASTTGSKMMNDWKDKLMEFQDFSSHDEYVKHLLKTTNIQKIDNPYYLWMHTALQNILQNKGGYKFEVSKSEDGPFSYLEKNGFCPEKSVNYLVETKGQNNESWKTPLIKFRGNDRGQLEKKDNDKILE